VVNAYDNTIVYTDHYLASIIQWLKAAEKKSATAMIYVPDHGESLGENNFYLHGLPWRVAPDVQKGLHGSPGSRSYPLVAGQAGQVEDLICSDVARTRDSGRSPASNDRRHSTMAAPARSIG
jgi:Sulfatase